MWLDVRNADLVKYYISKSKRNNADFLKSTCGLPISTYFSALKLRWLIDNIPEVRNAVIEGRCLCGNVDSWLIWVRKDVADEVNNFLVFSHFRIQQNLTGSVFDGAHVTDVTNASRTMLMNLESLQWDPMLLRYYSGKLYSGISSSKFFIITLFYLDFLIYQRRFYPK